MVDYRSVTYAKPSWTLPMTLRATNFPQASGTGNLGIFEKACVPWKQYRCLHTLGGRGWNKSIHVLKGIHHLKSCKPKCIFIWLYTTSELRLAVQQLAHWTRRIRKNPLILICYVWLYGKLGSDMLGLLSLYKEKNTMWSHPCSDKTSRNCGQKFTIPTTSAAFQKVYHAKQRVHLHWRWHWRSFRLISCESKGTTPMPPLQEIWSYYVFLRDYEVVKGLQWLTTS